MTHYGTNLLLPQGTVIYNERNPTTADLVFDTTRIAQRTMSCDVGEDQDVQSEDLLVTTSVLINIKDETPSKY